MVLIVNFPESLKLDDRKKLNKSEFVIFTFIPIDLVIKRQFFFHPKLIQGRNKDDFISLRGNFSRFFPPQFYYSFS
jgi:hypothetical protein